MHDVGYWYNGERIAKGHPERSREYILSEPSKYLLDDFPPFTGNHPRVAEAVGWIAHGHSEERFLPLKEIPNNFPDKALSDGPLNLRKLAALLRMADEADDPYIRVKGNVTQSIRSGIPLVRIGTETIVWHWKHAGVQEPDGCRQNLVFDPSVFEVFLPAMPLNILLLKLPLFISFFVFSAKPSD